MIFSFVLLGKVLILKKAIKYNIILGLIKGPSSKLKQYEVTCQARNDTDRKSFQKEVLFLYLLIFIPRLLITFMGNNSIF